MTAPLALLDRRGGWVAVEKPAGIPSEPAPGFEDDVRSAASRALSTDAEELHVLNRLDVGVSGVVLLAASAETRRQAGHLLATHAIRRRYVAILSAEPEPRAGVWTWSLGRARGRRVAGGSDSEKAVTAYRAVAVVPGGSALVACEPLTGRTHQIRAHASTARTPVLFDRRYGARGVVTSVDGGVLESARIALHAARIIVPLEGGAWVVVSRPEPELGPTWTALGGSLADFGSTLEVTVPSWDGALP